MGKVDVDNPMTRVKRNNEVDLCEVKNGKVRRQLEGAMQYARISYFLRWIEPGFFERTFLKKHNKLIFCVNAAQFEDALEVISSLGLTENDVKILGQKSQNKYIY